MERKTTPRNPGLWVRYSGRFKHGTEGLTYGQKPIRLKDGGKRIPIMRARPTNPSMLRPKSPWHSGLTEQTGNRSEVASHLRTAKLMLGRKQAVKIMREGRKLSGY